ncbi:MAG: putative DNA binding domain-containing protein [Thermonemataceae bacterium]|nr:putative DNA binding domain-containing protein [Thermonemataceae bacterium]
MVVELQNLKKIVRQGEGLQLEFKLKTKHPEKIIREIIAFANTKGGMLMVGISDDKQLIGAKFPDEDEFILQKAIAEYCFPEISYQIERISLDEDTERSVLIFHIPPSTNPPHYIQKGEDKGKVYVRVADRSIQASKEMKMILKEQKKRKNFRFNYGEKESLLVQYLSQHPYVTIEDFAKIAHISPKTASRTLVLLCLANVLRIEPQEEKDRYLLVE